VTVAGIYLVGLAALILLRNRESGCFGVESGEFDHCGERAKQASLADGGGKPPHSTWAVADGMRVPSIIGKTAAGCPSASLRIFDLR
jgi:hypothetical protein